MINVRSIANSIIQITNPNISIEWLQSTGYTTNTAGKRIPSFNCETLSGQVQALSGNDLQHIDGLNIQGIMRSVYLYGNIQGINRESSQGGDLLQFPEVPGSDVRNWKIVQVMETWPTWCRVIALLQPDTTAQINETDN